MRAAATCARRLRNLAGQSARRQRLVVEAAVLLVGLKAVMSVLPYRAWKRLVVIDAPGHPGPLSAAQIADVAWAVDRVGRQAPRALDCLPRALTARAMLRRRGADPALHLGAATGDDRELIAHAWLEIDGEVVLGDVPDLERFQRLRRGPAGD